MTEWYCRLTDEVIGPVSWEQLKQKADEGQLAHQTPVREGVEGPWIAASEVPGLLGSPAELAEPSDPQEDVPPEIDLQAQSEDAARPEDGTQGAVQQEPDIQRSPLALRPCSDCGQMVSKQASTCPHCGRAFHESSFTAHYKGEQPVVTFAVIALLAIAFLILSPVVVYRGTMALAPRLVEASQAKEMALTELAIDVTGFYIFWMLACTFLGGAVGRPRMAYLTGCALGLFFGPLGVFAAFAIDKRPQCPQCASRLSGLAKECPCCHARLVWKVEPTWY
jgi:hypothetical protein